MDEKAFVNDYANTIMALGIAKQAQKDMETFISITKVFIEKHDETSKLFTHEQDELIRVMFDYYLNSKLKPELDFTTKIMQDFTSKYDNHE